LTVPCGPFAEGRTQCAARATRRIQMRLDRIGVELRIEATHIDPMTGEPDPHGIPQIACPARCGEVNPQFTCLRCPFARGLETHQAVDDRGSPFFLVDAVECAFEGEGRSLPARLQAFPTPLMGVVEGAAPRMEAGVICPLLAWPGQSAPLWLEADGAAWVPIGNCRSCQFFRGMEGEADKGRAAVASVICSCPDAPASLDPPISR